MKKVLMVLCMLVIPVSMASALPQRGFVGGQNEVQDSDFSIAQSIQSGSGNPADAVWSINPASSYSFIPMWHGASGYSFNHGQQAGDSNQMITAVNAMDGNLYNAMGTSQMIDLSFFAHIDDGGYIIVGVHWWDSIDSALLQNPINPMALPMPDHEMILYHEDPYDSSVFVVTSPDGEAGDVPVDDVQERSYDLYQYQTTIMENPQYMAITVTIGHDEESGPLPSSAYFTDLQFQQMSLVVVPEPATMILLGMGLIAGCVRKLRK